MLYPPSSSRPLNELALIKVHWLKSHVIRQKKAGISILYNRTASPSQDPQITYKVFTTSEAEIMNELADFDEKSGRKRIIYYQLQFL